MRVGVILSPVGDWRVILESAKIADSGGLDAVGFWDHYHSEKPEWAYVCGWSAYGALAAATERIRLVPMVICRLNYTLGVLAKETAILSIASGGRFELGIGAGDYPAEYTAWHQPFPDASTRVKALEETIAALRLIWQGGGGDLRRRAHAADQRRLHAGPRRAAARGCGRGWLAPDDPQRGGLCR